MVQWRPSILEQTFAGFSKHSQIVGKISANGFVLFWLNDIDLQTIAFENLLVCAVVCVKEISNKKNRKKLCQFVLRTAHPFARSSKSFSFLV